MLIKISLSYLYKSLNLVLIWRGWNWNI